MEYKFKTGFNIDRSQVPQDGFEVKYYDEYKKTTLHMIVKKNITLEVEQLLNKFDACLDYYPLIDKCSKGTDDYYLIRLIIRNLSKEKLEEFTSGAKKLFDQYQ